MIYHYLHKNDKLEKEFVRNRFYVKLQVLLAIRQDYGEFTFQRDCAKQRQTRHSFITLIFHDVVTVETRLKIFITHLLLGVRGKNFEVSCLLFCLTAYVNTCMLIY